MGKQGREDFKKILVKQVEVEYNVTQSFIVEDYIRRNTVEREMIIVLDFGGQYNQLIARRVRECNVYCEVHPHTLSLDKIKEMNPKGIILLVVQTAYIRRNLPAVRRKSLKWEYRFWESATVLS